MGRKRWGGRDGGGRRRVISMTIIKGEKGGRGKCKKEEEREVGVREKKNEKEGKREGGKKRKGRRRNGGKVL